MTDNNLTLTAIESPNIDLVTYRGSASLAALSRLSQTDTFDQDLNPAGLQRDLSRKHALEAYDYAAREPDKAAPRAFPEVFLNVRDKRAVTVAVENGIATLTFDVDRIDRALAKSVVAVSRLDGNHRLAFGHGDGKDRQPLDTVMVPFSITVGLTPEQEGSLFLDVNAEHKGLNTSHLHVLRSRLTPDSIEAVRHPERVFARQLAADEQSPWNGLVHMGGSRKGATEAGIKRPISFVALESGVRRLLASEELKTVTDPARQYELIRRFWRAVVAAKPEVFESHADYMATKNIGIQSLSQFGARVLDRAMARGTVEEDHLLPMVTVGMAALDWSKDGSLAGMSGNRAAGLLAGQMKEALDSA